jgi:hypothetical protein
MRLACLISVRRRISFVQPSTIERISSGSVRSESDVNPDRSANRTVTRRRSPSSALAAPDVDEPLLSHGAPHDPQKRKPGGLSWPHEAHFSHSDVPQWPQKRCVASLTSAQPGQGAVPAKAESPSGALA